MRFKSSFPTPAVVALCFCSVGGTTLASADLGAQLFKLLPDDGALHDKFGDSVAISGTTAIVGADFDDDNGTDSGSAYLFDTRTGLQLFKLLPNDGASGDLFGVSVAISGDTAIVGAWWDDDNGGSAGSAYLFDTNTGRQLNKLLASDGATGDGFGISVAINGETAIVGAQEDDDNGGASGSAYLFDATTGHRIAKLLPNDGAVGDRFGHSVAISGATAIVGAFKDDDNGSNSGSAYLFDIVTGQQIAKLQPHDGAAEDFFGVSVAISDTIAIVGAQGNGFDCGAAYLFDTITGRQVAKIIPNDGAACYLFGRSVAINGATAIVAAVGDNDNGSFSGSAFLFDTTSGLQIAKLLANDGAPYDLFGWSVAISGATARNTAIVGAYGDDDNGFNAGSAYLFDATSPGTCPWDLDANGSVGASDLLSLLVAWGRCDDCDDCPADFDGNCTVGATDLLALLVNWGPCP